MGKSKWRSNISFVILMAWLTCYTRICNSNKTCCSLKENPTHIMASSNSLSFLYLKKLYDLSISNIKWLCALYGSYYLLICSFGGGTAHYLLCIMHYNYNNSLINHQPSVLLLLCGGILGNGVVYHLASSNISLCFTTLNCSNKANGYWKELAICLYFLLLLFRRARVGGGVEIPPPLKGRGTQPWNRYWQKTPFKKNQVRFSSGCSAWWMVKRLLCGFGVGSQNQQWSLMII